MEKNRETAVVVIDGDRSRVIDQALPVIRALTYASLITGSGAFICGIITIVFSSPNFFWPFTTGSGIWAGFVTLSQGCCGIVLLMNFNKSFPQATKSWLIAFYTCGIVGMSVAPQHLSYSIIGLSNCAARSKTGDGVEQCNPDHHQGLLVLQVLGTVFAVVMETVAITTLVYMVTKRRLVHLTGGHWKGGQCYSDCTCCKSSVSYNDI